MHWVIGQGRTVHCTGRTPFGQRRKCPLPPNFGGAERFPPQDWGAGGRLSSYLCTSILTYDAL